MAESVKGPVKIYSRVPKMKKTTQAKTLSKMKTRLKKSPFPPAK